MVNAILEGIARRERARVLASLIRTLGDFDLAEDALQDAYVRALQHWPTAGVPDRPAAWLLTVARRAALDQLRGNRMIDRQQSDDVATADAWRVAPIEYDDTADDDSVQRSGVDDDRLRLIFTCCHPAIAPKAQAALALRTLCGLETREIARAFLEPEATTAQRLVRAKQKIREAGIPFAVPARDKLPDRTAVVLGVIYLVFNEGYAATEHASFVRAMLCAEAIRLARLVVELLPDDGEARGLLALLLLTDARRASRLDECGMIVPLELQDRTKWDIAQRSEGIALVAPALAQGSGPYRIQAAIAALHAEATTAAETDWLQIVALYAALLQHTPSPVVELNAAAALAMAIGPKHGLMWMNRLADDGQLKGFHLLPAAQADLLRRLKRWGDAADAYRAALQLVTAPAERRYLEWRLAEALGNRD